MKIKVIRTSNISNIYMGHVYLEAWTCDINDTFNYSNRIKLDYYYSHKAFIYNFFRNYEHAIIPTIEFNPILENTDSEDDNSVILESNVTFHFFCDQLVKNGLDNNENFNIRTNNCVDAVIVALQISGILIDSSNHTEQCKHICCCFWGSTNNFTPSELILTLKKLKKDEVNLEGEFLFQSGIKI